MNREFPQLIKSMSRVFYLEDDEVEWIDFEFLTEFESAEATKDWIQLWMGNKDIDGAEYLLFGSDMSGGYGAIWCVRDTDDLLAQPVVFFGSEGNVGVVTQNFYQMIWLFAHGKGPAEAIEYLELKTSPHAAYLALAEKYAMSYKSSPEDILAKANEEFPNFATDIEALVKY